MVKGVYVCISTWYKYPLTAFVVSKEENSFMLINSSEESSVPHAFPNSHFKKNLNLHLDILINLDNVTLVSFKDEEKNEEDKLNDLYTHVSFISYDRLEAAYGLNKKRVRQ